MEDSAVRACEFEERGFVCERGFFSRDEVARMLGEIEGCVAEDRGAKSEGSGGASREGEMIFTTETYRRSEIVRSFIAGQRIIDFLRPIAGADLWVRWDQAVTKMPGAGVFHWHQDNAFNKLRREHFQIWVALTESHEQNGGIWLAPGSHRRGLLPHVRLPGQRQVRAEVGESVCIDASAGDLIVFSSLMLHRTGPNLAGSPRVAYVAEYMPLADYDYAAKAPYFVVARDGRSDPHFVSQVPGNTAHNKRLYWKERALHRVGEVARRWQTALQQR